MLSMFCIRQAIHISKCIRLNCYKKVFVRMTSTIRLLNQQEATNLDLALFNDYKFSVDQLMELAGLSVAIAIAKTFPLSGKTNNVLVICGPGNNGGDGLVSARHLSLFGYNSTIYYPKRTQKPLYQSLFTQCTQFGVEVMESVPTAETLNDYKLVVDALFGFSFKPPVRDELKPLMDALYKTNTPIASVDIPSGWDVDNGPPLNEPHIMPSLLISLSAPKQCVKYWKGDKHYLGGRFLPHSLLKKFNIELPNYPGTEQVVALD